MSAGAANPQNINNSAFADALQRARQVSFLYFEIVDLIFFDFVFEIFVIFTWENLHFVKVFFGRYLVFVIIDLLKLPMPI